MSRKTCGKPALAMPRVILGREVIGDARRARTLIGQASRALYIAGRADAAEELRAALLAADPAEYLPILRAAVTFWPAEFVRRHPVGDPATHWASARIPPAQRRK